MRLIERANQCQTPNSHHHRTSAAITRTVSPLYATQEDTLNWAGVVATGWGYSDVSSDWTLPSIGNKQDADVSPWIGLGGDTSDGYGNLPQVGVDVYLDIGQQNADATMWWEDLQPGIYSPPQNIYPPIGVRDPRAGDTIYAEVTDGPNDVRFFIEDSNTGEYFGQWVNVPPSNGSTADWEIEYNNTYLADFPNGQGFLTDYVTRNGNSQSIGQVPTNSVDMFKYGPPYSDQQAFPGPIHNGDHFYDWWTSY